MAKSGTTERQDLAKIAEVTPFSEKDLEGQKLRRGSMLGGANPVIESVNPVTKEG